MKRRWREGGWGWSFGDRVEPLRRWIRKNVGRPLSKVYSEFCEHADARTLRGWHAREHFWIEVESYQEYIRIKNARWGYVRFYEDEHGILCEDKTNRNWRRRFNEASKDPDNCSIDGRSFVRINQCWFEVWHVDEQQGFQYWCYIEKKNKTEYRDVAVVDKQCQLSRKELKTLGLSNDPDFLWWEK